MTVTHAPDEAFSSAAEENFPGAAEVAAFVQSLEARQTSSYTRRNYAQALRDFFLWARSEVNFSGDFREINRRLARDFIVEKQRTHTRKTVHNQLAAIRGFFDFLLREKILEESPWTVLRSPKIPKRVPQFLTEKQMARLLAAPQQLQEAGRISAWERVRDEAMLECLYGGGLRVAELCGLDHGHFDFAKGLVRILGKGNKIRVVPLGEVALRAVENLAKMSERTEPDAPVFKTAKGERMYPRAVQLLLKRYLAAAELPGDFTPHKLRHSCATHLLDHEADLRMIQEQLGHSSLSSTQIYTHVTLSRLKAAYSKAHPRA